MRMIQRMCVCLEMMLFYVEVLIIKETRKFQRNYEFSFEEDIRRILVKVIINPCFVV